ncbi:MAG: carboxypeptidase regulatory-like domain-containing protein [Lachnospiraceae bacterium]|nr:carboxypeptidase regulatory-like domain-containing protein [Lachnospiraceae bacterium]
MKKYGAAIYIALAAVLFTACGTETTETVLPEASEEASVASTGSGAGSGTNEAEAAADSEETPKEAAAYPDRSYAEKTDERLLSPSAFELTRTRSTDSESGDIVDISVYRIKGDIVKIITEDYGSDGEIVSEYYYDNDNVVFLKQYRTDIYGLHSEFTEADLKDINDDYTKGVYEQAGKALSEAKENRGDMLLYGYVGDEQGGVLENVTVKLRNLAGDVNLETVTDGDGYYTFNLPQTDETYNLTYTYGTYLPGSLNDVHITPGTPEYSLGKVYVAPEGHAVHDTDVYLLNANIQSPVKLKNGEYLAVLNSEEPGMALKLISKKDQSSETGNQIQFKPDRSREGYALYVEDTVNLSKDDMSGNMGRSNINVTIFDKDGIAAAYLVPAGRLGTLWRVCDIDYGGEIAISGIMYTDSTGWK